MALFLCGEFPLARIDANWFCRAPLPDAEKRNCRHCATLSPPTKVMDTEEHMLSQCPRFLKHREEILNALEEESKAALIAGTPIASLKYILTCKKPQVWRRFAWMLANIYAIRRKGWTQYQQTRLDRARTRQRIRNRAPRLPKHPLPRSAPPDE